MIEQELEKALDSWRLDTDRQVMEVKDLNMKLGHAVQVCRMGDAEG